MTAAPPRSAADAGQSAVNRVAVYLRAAILNGDFRPGDRIRQEDVAARLGSSRLPVREALRIVELEGLVENETNKGARVPLLGPREVDLLYRMRERLEPLAISESIPRLVDADVEALHGIQERIEATSDINEFLTLDREFHLSSYSHCDMEPLSTTIVRLWNSTQHYRRMFMLVTESQRRWVVNSEHNLLLDALERRDAPDAELRLHAHIRRTRVALSHHPETFTR